MRCPADGSASDARNALASAAAAQCAGARYAAGEAKAARSSASLKPG
ncbi:hypothetical protein HC928_10540 [bacterium]|nr:hypothetical protein [bacterium]